MEEFIKNLKRVLKFPVRDEMTGKLRRIVMESVEAKAVKEQLENLTLWRAMNGQVSPVLNATAPSPRAKAALKERLVNFIELKQRRRPFFTWHKRIALAMSLFLVFIVGFTYLTEENLAQAQHLTYLAEVEGEVLVQRRGFLYRAEPNMILRKGDVVKTSREARAVVNFFDDSVSRLDESTEVVLEDLSVNPVNKTNTVVALNVRQGRTYNRVMNLVSDASRFSVSTHDVVTVVDNNAAFTVAVADHVTEVTSIDNTVALEVVEQGKKEKKSLAQGKKVQARKKSSGPVIQPNNATLQDVQDAADLKDSNDALWIEENLKEDVEYIAQVEAVQKAVREKDAGILPGNVFYPVKVLAQDANVYFTFDKVEKSRKKLALAKQKMAGAQVLLERGDVSKGKVLLEEFKTTVEEVVNETADVKDGQFVNAENLKAEINETIKKEKKNLVPVLPGTQLYEAKQVLKEAELKVVEKDKTATAKIKLQQAIEEVQEVEDLVDQKQPDLAQTQLKKAKASVKAVTDEVVEIPYDEQYNVLEEFVETQAAVKPLLEKLGQDETFKDDVKATQASFDTVEKAATDSQAVKDVDVHETDAVKSQPTSVQDAPTIPLMIKPTFELKVPAPQKMPQ